MSTALLLLLTALLWCYNVFWVMENINRFILNRSKLTKFFYKNWCVSKEAKGAKQFTYLKYELWGCFETFFTSISYVINFDGNDWVAIIISRSLNATRLFKLHKRLVAVSVFASFIWNASHLKVSSVVYFLLVTLLLEWVVWHVERKMNVYPKRKCCKRTLNSEFGMYVCVFIMCDSLH